jgi:hypothetical protein
VRGLFILSLGLLALAAYEGAIELQRQRRWHSEDPAWWRRKVAYQAEIEEVK